MEQTLLCLALAIFAGLMLSRLAKLVQLPAVTAYLVAGILIGPFLLGSLGVEGLGFTSAENIESFGIISDVALGFIAFSIGNEFRLSQLKQIGKKRGCLIKGGEIDMERATKVLLTEFRAGKLGKICLE